MGLFLPAHHQLEHFFEIMSKDYDEKTLLNNLQKTKVVAIGPFTAEDLKKFNVENIISNVHTVEGAFETIKKIFSLAPPTV